MAALDKETDLDRWLDLDRPPAAVAEPHWPDVSPNDILIVDQDRALLYREQPAGVASVAAPLVPLCRNEPGDEPAAVRGSVRLSTAGGVVMLRVE